MCHAQYDYTLLTKCSETYYVSFKLANDNILRSFLQFHNIWNIVVRTMHKHKNKNLPSFRYYHCYSIYATYTLLPLNNYVAGITDILNP